MLPHMAASDVVTLMTDADAALASGDYASALTLALRAQARLIAIPDATDSTGATMSWRTQSIADFIATVRSEKASAQGRLKRQSVEYKTVGTQVDFNA